MTSSLATARQSRDLWTCLTGWACYDYRTMLGRKKSHLVLRQLKKGTLFKLLRDEQVGNQILASAGVYQVRVAKADHGHSMKVTDWRTSTIDPNGNSVLFKTTTIPLELAKAIRVYRISN